MATTTKKKPRAVRVGWELDDLQVAIEGIRRLVDRLHGESDGDASEIASSVGALLGLVATRLRDLRRAIQGAIDPGTLGSANVSPARPGEQDVFLVVEQPTRKARKE